MEEGSDPDPYPRSRMDDSLPSKEDSEMGMLDKLLQGLEGMEGEDWDTLLFDLSSQ
jgi:hypothetical protein